MSIYFNQETMQFYLHTKHTSYVMELYANHLAHSYWGSRVNEIPNLEAYYPFWFGADFSAWICIKTALRSSISTAPGQRNGIFNDYPSLPQPWSLTASGVPAVTTKILLSLWFARKPRRIMVMPTASA